MSTKPNPSVPLRSYQSAASANSVVDDASSASSLWGVAFVFAIASIFILYSRFFDVVANGFKIPRVILSLMVVFFLVSGRALVFLRSPTGKILFAMVGWASVTLTTSIWKTGSLVDYYLLLQSALMFVVVAGLPLAVRHVKRIMTTLAMAGLVAMLLSIPFGSMRQARLSLSAGNYYDPNTYAMCLIVVIPFFWAIAANTRSMAAKIFCWLSIAGILFTFARAGSRGAMLGFGIMILLLFIISGLKTKLLIVTATIGGIVVAAAVMPEYIRTRYLTFFEVDKKVAQEIETPARPDSTTLDLEHLRSDTASAEERERLLLASIAITFQHPIFGVGPGNFPTAVFEQNNAAGIHTQWLVTHNSYTEISSETGLPGLILLLALLISGFKCLISVMKRARETGDKPDPEAYTLAKNLLLSLTALSVGVFFLAVGYECMIYLWAAMAVSLKRTFDAQPSVLEEAEAEQPQRAEQKPALAPAYAKVRNPVPPRRQTQTVEGRPVRFNRFR